MAFNKSKLVELWWQERVQARAQVGDPFPATCRPMSSDTKWKDRISTDELWDSFKDWIDANYPAFANDFSKVGFCTMFYRVSGAKKSTIQYGSRRVPAAKFECWTSHRQGIKQPDPFAAAP